MFCLLVVLVKLSVLAKWLAGKTPLRKHNRGEGIVSRKPRPKSACDFLVYCIASLFYYVFVLSPALRDIIIFLLFMAWYSLFVLLVPLTPSKQTNPMAWYSLFVLNVPLTTKKRNQIMVTLTFSKCIWPHGSRTWHGPTYRSHQVLCFIHLFPHLLITYKNWLVWDFVKRVCWWSNAHSCTGNRM